MKGYAKVKAEGGPFDSLIQDACTKYGVPYDLLHKQLFLESSFNPKAVSPTGPRGLAQMTRATGLAYGLERDEDFFDPAKSIDAAARHMKDNLKIAGGDQLKALLIYNQGAGRNGRKQLEAYDRGDFSGISKEGLHYMRTLMDVTTVGNIEGLAAYPKTEGGYEQPQGSAFNIPEGVGPRSPTTTGLDPEATVPSIWATEDPASFNMAGVEGAPKAKPFAQIMQEHPGKVPEDAGLFHKTAESAEEGIKNSVLGMAIRAATQNDNVDFSQSFTMLRDTFNDPFELGRLTDWTDEEYERLRQSDLDPEFYEVVLRGYRRNFDQNLKLALENQALVKGTEGAGLGAGLLGGVAAIPGDPYSLIGPGKAAAAGGLGSRLVGGAIAGGAVGGMSEHASSKASGREEHLGMAIAGGAAFGGLLNGLLGARPGKNSWDSNSGPDPDAEMTPSDLRSLLPSREEVPKPLSALEAEQGALSRLQAREQARLQGAEEDPVSLPFRDGEKVHEDGAVPFSDVPFDPDAARTANGAVHTGGSILNPKTVRDFKEINPWDTKANPGVSMGGLSDIGYKLARSENEQLREVAYDLFRSSTGYTNGSNGKFGATAADLLGRFDGLDKMAYRKFQGILDDAHKDPFWQRQSGTKAGKQELMSRRVVETLEGSTKHNLTPAERQMLEAIREHMGTKWSYIENPGQFGNPKARSLLEETRHEGSYFPQRYSTDAKNHYIRSLGEDGLQEAIKRSWLASYAARPNVRARVDRMVKDAIEKDGKTKATPEAIRKAVEKYAHDKAYGISHTDKFNRSTLLEEHLKDGAGLENNEYLEARNLFDSDVSIKLPDGSDFSVNDLREFDILRVVPQYDRRVNGDVAIMGSTGRTTKELKEIAAKIHQASGRGDGQVEAEALMDALKMLTGRARREPDNAIETLIRSLNDIGFATKNAYMGVQNFTEAARLIVSGQQRMLLKNIPVLKRLTTKGTDLEPDDIKLVHDLVFGKEMDDLIRPSRADIVDRLRERYSAVTANIVGNTKWATGEVATRSPFTWLLRESGNFLMSAGRQGMMIDLAHQTLNGKTSKLFSPERLRAASITPEQFAGIQDLIKTHFKRSPEGKWTIENPEGLQADPRSMDLWRLGDRYADEVVLRPHKMSNQASKQYGAVAAMALQFKMFVLRSVNGRMMRGYWEAYRNSQKADEALGVLVSIGLSTAFYAAMAHLKAMALPERRRADYLEKAFTPSMMAYAAVSRSSHIGAPFGIANFFMGPLGFDGAAMVRTSILPRDGKQVGQNGKPIRYSPLESDLMTGFAARTAEQVPALQALAYGTQGIYSAAHLMEGNRGEDLQGHRTGLWNALRQFVPNDPLSQNILMNLANDQGVDRAR